MVSQRQCINLSLSHKPGRTGYRARVDPGNVPPSSREHMARKRAWWSEITQGTIIPQEMMLS